MVLVRGPQGRKTWRDGHNFMALVYFGFCFLVDLELFGLISLSEYMSSKNWFKINCLMVKISKKKKTWPLLVVH